MSELIKFQLADNSKSMDDTKGNAVTLPGQGAPNGKKKGPADEVDSDDELLGDDADFVFMQEYRSKRLEGIIKCYRNALPILYQYILSVVYCVNDPIYPCFVQHVSYLFLHTTLPRRNDQKPANHTATCIDKKESRCS